MPSKKRGSDNSSRSSRPGSSRSTARNNDDTQEENSRDAPAASNNNTSPAEYAVNTRVLCQHTDSFFYDAKIINVAKDTDGESLYTIHYNVSLSVDLICEYILQLF